MPFDLTFTERQVIQDRQALSQERRATLRKAIGEASIERIASLAAATRSDISEDPADLIPLHSNGLIQDLKHDWLAAPIVDLFDEVGEVARLDLNNDAVVGRRLRGAVERLVVRAQVVDGLATFFGRFEESVLSSLVQPAAECGLVVSSLLFEWMTSAADDASMQSGARFTKEAAALREHRMILCALPYFDQTDEFKGVPLTAQTEIEHLVRIEYPRNAPRWIDVLRHFESTGNDLCELGLIQLRYLGPYETADQIWSRNFFDMALRVGQSAYPLLAHRSAYLAWELYERAATVDETQTLSAVRTLFDSESLWMISSQEGYTKALARYRAGDPRAILEAYRDLTEGTLRRYGSLVVALERLSSGSTVQQPLVFESIGDVESQLWMWDTEPLPTLLGRFLDRNLRNADAHSNVVVAEDGTLLVKMRDGMLETVIPNHAYGRTAGLRSILDGVDVALNHAFIREKERTPYDLSTEPRPPMSANIFERVVQRHAEEETHGLVSRVRRRDNELIVTFHGEAVAEELRGFANSLTRLLEPTLPTILILDEDDAEIAKFLPPRRRAPAGRNEPCPCGSGRKYKRCHGA
jgi:hypothetical protein